MEKREFDIAAMTEWERHMRAVDDGPFTTDFDKLIQRGLQLPEPGVLDDVALTAKLWEVINALAMLRTFLERTDHLSDRELYEFLWNRGLRGETPIEPLDVTEAFHLDVLGGCSDEDLRLNLKYYADEDERRDWAKDWPDDPMPDHEDLPFDRDRHLPQPDCTLRKPE